MGDQWGRAPTAGQSFGDARQPSFSTQGPASAYPASSPGVNAGRSYTPPSVYSNAGPAPAQPRPGSVYILKAGPKAGSEMAPVVPQVTAAPTIAIERILDGLREQLKTRGAVGVLGLSRNFRILDRDKRGSLDSTEFARLVQMCRLEMTDAEVSLLFTRFDSDGNGCIDFGEFLESVRGAMPPCRRNLIAKVFHALDTLGDGNGVLELGDIQNAFDARSSPEVLAGRKSEREVLTEFLNGFEGLKGNHDGRVSFEEWLGYYEELSASMESDDAFGAMVVSAWSALKTIDANGREVPVIRYTATRAVDELERMMRVKIWQKSTRAKNERKTLEGAFKQFDSDGSLMISLAEFAKAMERFGLYASPDQIESLFNRYDADADGKVSPAEFMQILEVADEVQGLQIGSGAVQSVKQPPRPTHPTAPDLSQTAPGSGAPARQPSSQALYTSRSSAAPRAANASGGGSYLFSSTLGAQRPATASNARVRSLANPARTSSYNDPEHFKKSSGIFS